MGSSLSRQSADHSDVLTPVDLQTLQRSFRPGRICMIDVPGIGTLSSIDMVASRLRASNEDEQNRIRAVFGLTSLTPNVDAQ